jgi:hypothetical protein
MDIGRADNISTNGPQFRSRLAVILGGLRIGPEHVSYVHSGKQGMTVDEMFVDAMRFLGIMKLAMLFNGVTSVHTIRFKGLRVYG